MFATKAGFGLAIIVIISIVAGWDSDVQLNSTILLCTAFLLLGLGEIAGAIQGRHDGR